MALTGLRDDPVGPPAGLVEGIDRLALSFPGLDALALLGERAALMGSVASRRRELRGELPPAAVRRRLHGRVAAARRGHGVGSGMARARRRTGLGPGHVVRGRIEPAGRRSRASPGEGSSCSGSRRPGSASRWGTPACRGRPWVRHRRGPTSPEWSSSTSRRSGRARCAVTSWPAPARRWSRSSRRSGPTVRAADPASSSTC